MKKALLAIIGGLEKIRVYEDKILSEDNILSNLDMDGILVDNTNDILGMQSVVLSEMSKIVAWLSLFSKSFCEAVDSNIFQAKSQDDDYSTTILRKCLGLDYPEIILTEHIHASASDFASPKNLMKLAKNSSNGYYAIVNLFLKTLEEVFEFCQKLILRGDPNEEKYEEYGNICSLVRLECMHKISNHWVNSGLVCGAARKVSVEKVLEMLAWVSSELDTSADQVFKEDGTVISPELQDILGGLKIGFVQPLFDYSNTRIGRFRERGYSVEAENSVKRLLRDIVKKIQGKNWDQYQHVFHMTYSFRESLKTC